MMTQSPWPRSFATNTISTLKLLIASPRTSKIFNQHPSINNKHIALLSARTLYRKKTIQHILISSVDLETIVFQGAKQQLKKTIQQPIIMKKQLRINGVKSMLHDLLFLTASIKIQR